MSLGSTSSSLSYPSAGAFYKSRAKRNLPGEVKKRFPPKSLKALALQAWNSAEFLKKIVKPESKVHTAGSAANTVTSTPQIINLSAIAQGDDEDGRQGRKITVTSIQMLMNLQGSNTNPITLAPPLGIFRCLIFIDTATDAADPTATDIIADAFDLRVDSQQAFKRYRILYDSGPISVGTSWSLTASVENPIGIPLHHTLKFYKKLNLPITYVSTAATDASNGINSLYALVVSDRTTAANGAPFINAQWRIRYLDS